MPPGTLAFLRFRPRPSDHRDEMMVAERRGHSWERRRMVFVMRYVNADRAGMDVHVSSMAPTSVERAYHKILGAVKGSEVTPPSWGFVGCHRSVGKTIVKLGGRPGRVWITISTKRRTRPYQRGRSERNLRLNPFLRVLFPWAPAPLGKLLPFFQVHASRARAFRPLPYTP
jgi:hypothetical protein